MNPPPGIEALPNGQWVIEGDTHLSKWAKEHGHIVTDPHLMNFLKPHLEKVEVVWSVGANIGDHARQFVDWGKKVVAIEPMPRAYACLVHNVPECQAYNVAASDKFEHLQFAELENAGASRVSAEGAWSLPAVPLDEMNLPAPDFIAIDVEGWEPKALAGMMKTLKEHRPIVYVEVNEGALESNGFKPADISEVFANLGYSDVTSYPADAKYDDPQFDLLFLP